MEFLEDLLALIDPRRLLDVAQLLEDGEGTWGVVVPGPQLGLRRLALLVSAELPAVWQGAALLRLQLEPAPPRPRCVRPLLGHLLADRLEHMLQFWGVPELERFGLSTARHDLLPDGCQPCCIPMAVKLGAWDGVDG